MISPDRLSAGRMSSAGMSAFDKAFSVDFAAALALEEDKQRKQVHQSAEFKPLKVLAFMSNNAACRSALSVLRVFLKGKCSSIILVHCAQNQYKYEGMLGVLDSLATEFLSGFNVRTENYVKHEEQTVTESMQDIVEEMKPDLVVIASESLCPERETRSGLPGTSGMPANKAFALKICQALRHVPVFVYKANTKGGFGSYSDPKVATLRCMMDMQPTSRPMLQWLMNMMNPDRDSLYLAASKAYDGAIVKQTVTRMVTTFSVQASVSKFKPVRRVFKESSEVALPPAIEQDHIDILVVQANRNKELSSYVIDLLTTAKTSIIVFPPDFDSQALGRPSAAEAEEETSDPSHFSSSQTLTLGDRNTSDRMSFNAAVRNTMIRNQPGNTRAFGPVVTMQNGDLAIQHDRPSASGIFPATESPKGDARTSAPGSRVGSRPPSRGVYSNYSKLNLEPNHVAVDVLKAIQDKSAARRAASEAASATTPTGRAGAIRM